MQEQKSTNDLIDKINNVVNGIMKEEITDKMQSVLEMTFDKVKNKSNWKDSTLPLSFTFTFANYQETIQNIGLIAMSFSHFHGGYLLARIGKTDTVIIRSEGYYHYTNENKHSNKCLICKAQNSYFTYEISIDEIKKVTKRRKDQDFISNGQLVKVWSNEE